VLYVSIVAEVALMRGVPFQHARWFAMLISAQSTSSIHICLTLCSFFLRQLKFARTWHCCF